MNQLVIIGARAMGRETCAYARDAGMTVKGFLDSDSHALDAFHDYVPILSSVEDYCPEKDDVFICALGESIPRRKYVELISAKGGKFATVIHPTAYVGQNVKIGQGCVVCPHVTITTDCVIGDHVIINVNSSVNHDNRIGDFSTLCPGCRLAGRVMLGRDVFVGTGVVVIPDVALGDGVFAAAGATVTKSYSAGRIAGVPAVLM